MKVVVSNSFNALLVELFFVVVYCKQIVPSYANSKECRSFRRITSSTEEIGGFDGKRNTSNFFEVSTVPSNLQV